MQRKVEKKGSGEKEMEVKLEIKKEIVKNMNKVGKWPKLQNFIRSLHLHLICRGGREKNEESLTSNEIREMCKMWGTEQHFVEKHHPNRL